MSTSRPFAYNTGGPIAGTDQYGDLAVGVLNEPYPDNYGGVIWWEGPDEDLGYVIAVSVPDNTQPTPIFGVTASVGFYRSEFYTEVSYIEVANAVSGQNFTSGDQAAAWLLSNGYWTSWPGGGPTTSPTPTPTSTSTPAPTNTSIPVTPTNTATPSPTASQFAVTPTPTTTSTSTPTPTETPILSTPTPTGTPAGASVLNITLLEVGGNVVMSGAGTMNITSLGSPQPSFKGSTIAPAGAQFGCGTAGGGPFNCSIFTGGTILQPANFGTGGQTNGDSVTGDFFGIGFDGTDRRLFVPTGYVSGSFVSGTTTFNSTTLATLGATPGTYTWSWGSGANASSIVMTVGAVSVTPTPTSTSTPTTTSTSTPTPSVTNTQTPTTTPTTTKTPTPTPTSATTAPFSVSFIESGSDVLLSYSGILDLTGLDYVQSLDAGGGGVGPAQAAFGIGPTGSIPVYAYTGATFSYPSNFGPGGGGGSNPTGTGDYFGVFTIFGPSGPSSLIVPSGYTSNTYIAGTTTLTGQTFSSLGMSAGTYNYSWGAGSGQSFVLTIGGAGVTPTPTQTSQTPTPTPTSGATGNFTVTISQQGNDVIWNGSGSFNLAALTFAGTNTIGGGYAANSAIWAIGPSVTIDSYSGTITYPTSFGTGGTGVTSSAGSTFGILPGGSGRLLYVPSGYTSNTTISGSSTYANNTIAGMGLSAGTYTWSWGSGANASTLVMNIVSGGGATPTPTPTVTSTPTGTPASTPTSTPTVTQTQTTTGTPASTPTSTNTPTNTATNTPTQTSTQTQTPTVTPTPDPTPTNTPTPNPTPSPTLMTIVVGVAYNPDIACASYINAPNLIYSNTNSLEIGSLISYNSDFTDLVQYVNLSDGTNLWYIDGTHTIVSTGTCTYSCAQYSVTNNTGSPIDVTWYDCSNTLQTVTSLADTQQIIFCSNQIFGAIVPNGGTLVNMGSCTCESYTITNTDSVNDANYSYVDCSYHTQTGTLTALDSITICSTINSVQITSGTASVVDNGPC